MKTVPSSVRTMSRERTREERDEEEKKKEKKAEKRKRKDGDSHATHASIQVVMHILDHKRLPFCQQKKSHEKLHKEEQE